MVEAGSVTWQACDWRILSHKVVQQHLHSPLRPALGLEPLASPKIGMDVKCTGFNPFYFPLKKSCLSYHLISVKLKREVGNEL